MDDARMMQWNTESGAARSQAIADAVRSRLSGLGIGGSVSARAAVDGGPTPDAAGRERVGLRGLDYGCGPGHVGLLLADVFDHLTLVDADAEAVALARESVDSALGAPRGATVIDVRLGDFTRSVPGDLRVDVVFSAMAWHHVRDLDALLVALRSVAPGGFLFVADMDADGGAFHAGQPDFDGVHGFDRDELSGRVASHGYREVSVGDLWQGSKWIEGTLTPVSVFQLSARVPG